MPTIFINWEGRTYGTVDFFYDFKKAIDLIGRACSPVFAEHVDVGFAISDNPEESHYINAHGGFGSLKDIDPGYELQLFENWEKVLYYATETSAVDFDTARSILVRYLYENPPLERSL